MTMTDNLPTIEALAGDEAGAMAFVQSRKGLVKKFVTSNVDKRKVGRTTVKDIVAEIQLQAFMAIYQGTMGSTFKTWLYSKGADIRLEMSFADSGYSKNTIRAARAALKDVEGYDAETGQRIDRLSVPAAAAKHGVSVEAILAIAADTDRSSFRSQTGGLWGDDGYRGSAEADHSADAMMFQIAQNELALDATPRDPYRAHRVRVAIESLTPKQNEVISLLFGFSGGEPMTTFQVAEALGISDRMVRKHKSAGMAALSLILMDLAE